MSLQVLTVVVSAISLTSVSGDGYQKPVQYAGPIVYSGEKPPIVHFPKPPRVTKGYGGRGGASGHAKAPLSVKYVPLPHHDLPVLIYQSDSQPPIHVVHTPAPRVLPQSSSHRAAALQGYSSREGGEHRPAVGVGGAVRHGIGGISAGARGGVGVATSGGFTGHSSAGHANEGYSSGGQAGGGHSSGAQVGGGYSIGGQVSEGHSSGGQVSGGHSIGGQVSRGHSSSRGQVSRGHSSGGQLSEGYSSAGQVSGGRSSGGYSSPTQTGGHQNGGGHSFGGQVGSHSSLSSVSTQHASDSSAVYIKAPPAPAPVYVNSPQPVYVSAGKPQTSYGPPKQAHTAPAKGKVKASKANGGYGASVTSSYGASKPKAKPQNSYEIPKLKGLKGKSKGSSAGSYPAPISTNYKAPSKGTGQKAGSGYPAPISSNYDTSSKAKGKGKGSGYPAARPQSSYGAPKTSPAPHIIYAGHPPIHVYQQPQIHQVPETPTKAYGPPPTKGYTAPKTTQSKGSPRKPQIGYNSPPAAETSSGKYSLPVSSQYKAPSKGKAGGLGKYPASVNSQYGAPSKGKGRGGGKYPSSVNSQYGAPSKGSKGKGGGGGGRYPTPKPNLYRPSTKAAPVFLPAPKAYNKPPIIIYQGVRPPVHVYQAAPPSNGYGTPSRLSSSSGHATAQKRNDQQQSVTAAAASALEPRYSPQRRSGPAAQAPSITTSSLPSIAKASSDDWLPLGVTGDAVVPAPAYIMDAPDLSQQAPRNPKLKIRRASEDAEQNTGSTSEHKSSSSAD